MAKVTKKDETKVITNVVNLEADEGLGIENIKSDSTKSPYMKLLQSSNDETKKGTEKYVLNAEAGDLYIESSGQLFKGEQGVKVICALYMKTYNEWSTREAPAESRLPAPIIHTQNIMHLTTKQGTKDVLIDDPYRVIENTGNHFCLLLDDDYNEIGYTILTMAISKKKVSDAWNTLIKNQRAPRADGSGTYNPASFGQIYNLGSQIEKYYNYKVNFDRIVDTTSEKECELYSKAKKLYESFKDMDMTSSNPEGSSVKLIETKETEVF